MRSLAVAATVLALGCGACSRDEAPPAAEATPPAPRSRTEAPPAPSPETARPRVVVLGDSLTAGLGLAPSEAYPSLLQQRLTEEKLDYEVVNAGVSGDTSAGGLSRLDWALDGDVRFLILALGANDGLRGLPPEALKKNLAQIIERARARGITVVLAGMEAPPNYGRGYAQAFHDVYPALAKQYDIPFVPFLLEGVGGVARLNQADGIHPNVEGARVLADNVWTILKPLVEPQGS
jgi:acyl-CoA thioesterase-1